MTSLATLTAIDAVALIALGRAGNLDEINDAVQDLLAGERDYLEMVIATLALFGGNTDKCDLPVLIEIAAKRAAFEEWKEADGID